jgi:hypothetical protein
MSGSGIHLFKGAMKNVKDIFGKGDGNIGFPGKPDGEGIR